MKNFTQIYTRDGYARSKLKFFEVHFSESNTAKFYGSNVFIIFNADFYLNHTVKNFTSEKTLLSDIIIRIKRHPFKDFLILVKTWKSEEISRSGNNVDVVQVKSLIT